MRRTIFVVAIAVAGLVTLGNPASVLGADRNVGPYPGDGNRDSDASTEVGKKRELIPVESAGEDNAQLTGIRPGHVHSLWLVNIRNPTECETPQTCTMADLLFAPGQIGAEVDYLAGVIAGEDGTAVLSASPNPADPLGELLDADGAQPVQAEPHLMVIDHGPFSQEAWSQSTPGGATSNGQSPEDDEFAPKTRYEGTPGFTR